MNNPSLTLSDIAVDYQLGVAYRFPNNRVLTKQDARRAIPLPPQPSPVEKVVEAPLTEGPQPDNVLTLKRRK